MRKYNFQCMECRKQLFMDVKHKHVICQDCIEYNLKFSTYIEQFKKELPFQNVNYAVQRIIEYTYTINNYAIQLGIAPIRNKKFFEKFIEIASNDTERKYNFHKLKSDVHIECKSMLDKEDAISRKYISPPVDVQRKYNVGTLRSFEDYYPSSDSRRMSTSKQRPELSIIAKKHQSVINLIDNPNEYLDYQPPESNNFPVKNSAPYSLSSISLTKIGEKV